MHTEYNKITTNPLDHFSMYTYHFHSDFEVYYFVSGNASYLVEGKEYRLTPHSLLLLSGNVLHSICVHSNADYIRHCLYLSPNDILPERRNLLLSSFPNTPSHSQQAVYYENLQEYHFESFFSNINYGQSLPEPLRNQCLPIFLESFLAQAYVMFQMRHPSTISATAPPVILAVMEYLNSHIEESISLDKLSDQFHINKDYLNRAFKKAIGVTIMNYLMFKRVVLAKEYIANGESASNAALRVGFSDYSTFYRTYKRILEDSPSAVKHPIV